jgi:hypothetical protein
MGRDGTVFEGRSGMTRIRAVPVTAPTVALTSPAWAPAAASGVNLPPVTVPFSPSSVHVTPPWSNAAVVFPFWSNSLIDNATDSPGFRISSVGVTSAVAGAPTMPLGGVVGFDAEVFGVPFGPIA